MMRSVTIGIALMTSLGLAGCTDPDPCADPPDGGVPGCGEPSTPPGAPNAAAPTPRVGPAMAYDSTRGVVVLFGGAGGPSPLADTWERTGTTWTKRTPALSPPARTGASMVYDSARRVTVLFGGLIAGGGTGDATFIDDTWEWDGTTWTERTPSVSPGARYYAATAFDASRNVTVMFGGSDRGHTAFEETWEWDGTSWTMYPATAPSPSARADAPMACDARRGVCTMFGGDDGTRPTDTWERDGTVWSQRDPPTSPPDRRGSAMVYDSDRAVDVLFGGHHGERWPAGSVVAETWEWESTTWTQRTVGVAPPARSAHGMAYDAGRGVTVMFGGTTGSQNLGDTWEWDGTSWTQD